MSILAGLLSRTAESEKRNLHDASFFGGAQTYTGKSVTPATAMTTAAVYACVRIISETIASLPLHVYERVESGKRRATEFPLYSLLHDAPNSLMTSFEFREVMQAHLLLWGNAFAEIDYNGRGGIEALWPLQPAKMHQIKQDKGKLYYQYERPDHSVEWIPGDTLWHLRGLGSDGLYGYSPIQLMRNAVGVSLATEEFAGRFFGNGAQLGGVLRHPGVLGEPAFNRLQESWGERHGGLSNAHKTAILEEGMEYQQITIPPEDAQFLETRKFQVTEVARIFRVPPHMLADLERATFSNIEQQSIDFVVNTIRPWLVRWEQSIQQNLMLARYRSRYFTEFLVDGLLRGDIGSRYEAYAKGRQNGWLSANDIRTFENMNEIDSGDIYLVPLNMVPAEDAGETNTTENNTRSLLAPGAIETRARVTAAARLRLIGDFIPAFRETFGRVVRREVADVKRQARKTVGKDDLNAFLLWLPGFYEEHQAFMNKSLAPIFAAYMAAIIRAVQRELDNEEPIDLEAFTASYLDLYGVRYTTKQQKYLLAEIERTQEADEDMLAAIENQMDTWDEERPEQEANRESRRGNNAIAMAAYGALGVTIKRWATIDESCPYCNKLDGKTVEVDGYFMAKGDAITAEGQSPLPISINLGHPPAHDGCDCMVVAG